MNTTEKIYERMIEKAVDLYKTWVISNHKMRQLDVAKFRLIDSMNENGDTGISFVMEMLKEQYRSEKRRNEKLTAKHYAYVEFVEEYARSVKELEGTELPDVNAVLERSLADVHSELKQKDRECADEYLGNGENGAW